MNEPNTFRAGDTVKWSEDFGDHRPTDGWSMKCTISGAQTLTVTAASSAGQYDLMLTAVQTGTLLSAGTYTLALFVERGSGEDLERITLSTTSITVLQNLSTAYMGDTRTHLQKALASIEAVIEKRATQADEEFTIAGRSLRRTPLADLAKLYTKYKFWVEEEQQRERIAKGLPAGNKILVHFR
jgi:hypothetical protein